MTEAKYPVGWLLEPFKPEDHLSKARKSSEKNDYLNVAKRLLWFVTDQRALIASGVATHSFIVESKIVSIDATSCTCEAYIRDTLGNEARDIGTETRQDFPDFPEKAATKAKGRALASLGYGTQFAPELDEGERIVDTPRQDKPTQATQAPTQRPQAAQPPAVPAEKRLTSFELKEAFAAFGYRGDTAWFTIATQVTGKPQAQLIKPGFSAVDLAKMQQRLKLLQDGKAREEAKKAS